MREDVEIGDDEICKKIVEEFENNANGDEIIVTVISSNGESKIIDYKKNAQQQQ